MPDDLKRIGEFAESGRGLPLELSRPGSALPESPLVREAYAPAPLARIGWATGLLTVGDLALDDPSGVAPDDPPRVAAARLHDDDRGWVAVLDGRRFAGVVYAAELLHGLAEQHLPETVRPLVREEISTCTPRTALIDAVREMLESHLRHIPVLGDDGVLLGILPLAAAAQAAGRDPAVRDLLEDAAQSPSLFARAWR
jgi:CBS domain-containing protein